MVSQIQPDRPGATRVRAAQANEPSIGQLVAQTGQEVGTLVKGHIDLAVAEAKQTATSAGKGIGMFAGAGITALIGIVVLSVAAGFGLVKAGLAHWLAFLIVGGFWILVALILAMLGKSALSKAKGLDKTVPSVKKTVEVVKEHARPGEAAPQLPAVNR